MRESQRARQHEVAMKPACQALWRTVEASLDRMVVHGSARAMFVRLVVVRELS
jgi:hypothetical protein